MPILDPEITGSTQLGQLFRDHPEYTLRIFIRDSRMMLENLNRRLDQIEAVLEDHETRIDLGGL